MKARMGLGKRTCGNLIQVTQLMRSWGERRSSTPFGSQSCPRSARAPGSTALSFSTLATRDLSRQGLEPRAPEAPERLQPGVDLGQRPRVDAIDPTRPLSTHSRKPALPQDFELLRHGRLGDAELPRYDLDDLTGR